MSMILRYPESPLAAVPLAVAHVATALHTAKFPAEPTGKKKKKKPVAYIKVQPSPDACVLMRTGKRVAGFALVARTLARACDEDVHSALLTGQSVSVGAAEWLVDRALAYIAKRIADSKQGMRSLQIFCSQINALLAHQTFVGGGELSVGDLAVYAALRVTNTSGLFKRFAHLGRLVAFLDARFPGLGAAVDVVTVGQNKSASAGGNKTSGESKTGKGQDGKKKSHGKAQPAITKWFTPVPEYNANPQALLKDFEPEVKRESGNFDAELPGASQGNLVTRFPPEPSGYLHLGHCKAVLLNQYFAQQFGGQMILRFDDTNPENESQEFVDAIQDDLRALGVTWREPITYTSDSFEYIFDQCDKLVAKGLAYVDDTPGDQVSEEKKLGKASARRDRPLEENVTLWAEMRQGQHAGWTLRAKIAPDHKNSTMRDPILVRYKGLPHHRTGDQFAFYPTYDAACPLVDSREGVTHALRTDEYRDRDEQYAWLIKAFDVRKVHIWEYSRMNFAKTTLSKRKLRRFIQLGVVAGWDDPRVPSVRGVLRRGLHVSALRRFVISQGASTSVNCIDFAALWNINKRFIDPIVPRYLAVGLQPFPEPPMPSRQHPKGPALAASDYAYLWQHVHQAVVQAAGGDPSRLCFLRLLPTGKADAVTDGAWPKVNTEFKSQRLHPKNGRTGIKTVAYAQYLLAEPSDVRGLKVGEHFTLMNWGNCIAHRFHTLPGTDVVIGADVELFTHESVKACKKRLNWVAWGDRAPENKQSPSICAPVPLVLCHFGDLLTKDKLEKEDSFDDFINYNTMKQFPVLGESAMRLLKQGDIIQIMRRGFYRVDRPYFGDGRPMVLFDIPTGKQNAMSTIAL